MRAVGFWAILTLTVGTAGWAASTFTVPNTTLNAGDTSNPGTVTIADPSNFTAVYAISDVHGLFGALQKLLTENGLTDSNGHWTGGRSLLIVVGDSIDKGAQSLDVLDEWIRLQPEAAAAGGRIVHLLGNHEAEFLADPTPSDDKAKALFDELKSRGIPLAELTSTQYPRGKFLRSLPLAARVGNWLFCHAGLMPEQSWDTFTAQALQLLGADSYGDDFFLDAESILESKKWWKADSATRSQLEARLDSDGLAGVVFGHQPKALNVSGESAQSDDGRLIKIDNGMAPEAGSHAGSLLIFPNSADLSQGKARHPQVFALVGGNRRSVAPESRKEETSDEVDDLSSF
jgi:hypothetical protein